MPHVLHLGQPGNFTFSLVQKSILYSHNEKALKCKPLLFSNGIPGGHALAAVQDHVQSMCAESAASQFSFL